MRLFIGFLIPEEAKKQIFELQREIAETGADCKNVEAANLHISMSFLGETPESGVESLGQEISEIADAFKKFEVLIERAKAIPSEKFVRVVALDITGLDGNLGKIMEAIRRKVGGDIKPPHLTLCRVKSTKNKENLLQFVEKYKSKYFTKIKISSLQLLESKLSRSGPEYSVVFEKELQG